MAAFDHGETMSWSAYGKLISMLDISRTSIHSPAHFGNGIQQHCAEWPLKWQWARAMTGGHMVAIAI